VQFVRLGLRAIEQGDAGVPGRVRSRFVLLHLVEDGIEQARGSVNEEGPLLALQDAVAA
jgi:hypothetical protein